jgi:exonuclease III
MFPYEAKKIISWNVRGLHDVDKCMCIRSLFRLRKADIVTLEETKLEQISKSTAQSLWGGQHLDWCQLDSRGAFGDILLIGDGKVVEKIKECVGNFSTACKFRSVNDHFEWTFTSVYGPNSDIDS